jgi:hypothetical protein
MEVKIKPIPGCAQVFLGLVTLGVAPLMAWLNERNWPRSVDEQGLVTRAGTSIAWNDFTKVTRVITTIGRTGTKTEHYELKHPKGKVILAAYRLVDGDQVFDYAWQHLPEQAKK